MVQAVCVQGVSTVCWGRNNKAHWFFSPQSINPFEDNGFARCDRVGGLLLNQLNTCWKVTLSRSITGYIRLLRDCTVKSRAFNRLCFEKFNSFPGGQIGTLYYRISQSPIHNTGSESAYFSYSPPPVCCWVRPTTSNQPPCRDGSYCRMYEDPGIVTGNRPLSVFFCNMQSLYIWTIEIQYNGMWNK